MNYIITKIKKAISDAQFKRDLDNLFNEKMTLKEFSDKYEFKLKDTK